MIGFKVDSLALKINRESVNLVSVESDMESVIEKYPSILMQDIE